MAGYSEVTELIQILFLINPDPFFSATKCAIPQAGARSKMTERNDPCTVQATVKAYRRYKHSSVNL